MRKLEDEKDTVYSCSKCGLCQSVCPIYKITKNDCTVSRGHFIMLSGLIKGDLKMSNKLNRYLDLCLKCSACSKFCPSGIDVVDIVALAKAEYFKSSSWEKFISFFQKIFFFNIVLKSKNLFTKEIESKKFDKKVLYFGGCKNKLSGNSYVVKILNSCGIEVITPDFDCCGIPFFVRGDLENFDNCMQKVLKTIKKYGNIDIVTTCASCEKTLKSYKKWDSDLNINVKNIFQYIRENHLSLKLKEKKSVTFHKPCNIENFQDILWILNNTDNLEYKEMENYDECCGLNGLTKLREYKIMLNLFKLKRNNIIESGTKTVLTSCLGCETALKAFALGKYKVEDFSEFLAKYIID